ncbi:MAG TPA: SUMF1/EgtB/PvdO family nonheme iron enzyme [Verrucomicrobiae bacterium]
MQALLTRLTVLVLLLTPCFCSQAQTGDPPTSLSIGSLRSFYSAPYLLDFNFYIRDQNNQAVVLNPSQFTVVCKENGTAISASETGYRLLADNKQLKCFVILDYTLSMLDPFINGDGNGDFKSDSAEAMELGAKTLLNALLDDAEVGLFEFHRADAGFAPKKVASLMRDKAYLTNQIDQIWNEVVWTSGSTKCWDALYLALSEFPTANPADDQRFLVFLSDGKDESSTYSTSQVISLAQTKGVRIYCMGYGQELTPAPLQNITTQTGGQYYPAGTAAALTQRFQQIAQDLRSQYILRWATLKRTASNFTPSFEITYSGIKATATPGSYYPPSYAGDELQGHLRFDTSLNPGNVASLVLRASYIPRGITRLRVNFATAWPFTLERVWFAEGGVCPTNWTFTVQQTNGIGFFELSSPTPANPFTALPFATLGKLVEFEFQGVTNLTKCFYDLGVDNSLYAQPGGPSFIIENSNAVASVLTELPHGTPITWLNQYGFTTGLVLAEITDHDGDGMPTWQEYLAGTNPTNAASVFRMQGAAPEAGGWRITFNTESNRLYRVDYTDTLTGWQLLQTNLLGNGQPRTVVDPVPAVRRFYRAVMTGKTNPPPPAGMVRIPTGSFTMGDTFNEGDSDARPTHTVSVSAFYMDKYEVTKALWDEVYNWALAHGYSFEYGAQGKATNHPAQSMTWYDAVKWCNARSEKENRTPAYYTSVAQTTVYRTGQVDVQNDWVKWTAGGYRLPTEAEWEKAARGGASGHRFPWSDSDTIQHSRANYNSDSYFSYDTSPTRGYHPTFATGGEPYTSPAGYFAANGYGLYDMAGNVAEWFWDWYGSYSSDAQSDPRGPTSGSYRGLRGGSWGYSTFYARCARRLQCYPDSGNDRIGFRCVVADDSAP